MASKTSFLLLVIVALHSTTGISIRSHGIELPGLFDPPPATDQTIREGFDDADDTERRDYFRGIRRDGSDEIIVQDREDDLGGDDEIFPGFGGDGGIIVKDREDDFGDDLWEVNDLEDAEWAFYQEMANAGVEDSGADLRYPSTWPCDYDKFNKNNKYRHPMTYPASTCVTKRKGVTTEDIKVILKTHNNFRNKVAGGDENRGSEGPQPKATNMRELSWNNELATVAQAWADQCIWAHDNNSDICTRPYSVGQNAYIKWTFSEDADWEDAITGWYDEVVNHPKEGAANFTSGSNNGQAIGHYTQVVWGKTYEIGCGAIYKTEHKMNYDFPWTRYYFCNYGPGANLQNTPVYESSGTCPDGKSENSNYPNLCK